MLRLRLDTTYLDLDPDDSLTLNIHNPLFDAGGAEALYSFPFQLPATPRNLDALSHANRLDNSSNLTTYAGAVLELDGIPFEHGVLELDDQGFTADNITATFKNVVPALFEQLDNLKLTNLLETVAIPSVTDAYWVFALSVPPSTGVTYTIIINTLAYTFVAPGSVPNAAVTQALALAINAAHPGLADTGFNDDLILYSEGVNGVAIDVPNLVNLDDPAAVTLGEAAQLDLHAFVDSLAITPDDRLTFPYLYWKKFYKNLVTGYNDRHNVWVDGEMILNEPSLTKLEWTTSFIPLVRVPYILDQIAAAIPEYFTVHQGFFAADDGSELIVLNNRCLDLLYYDRYPNNGGGVFKYLNGFKADIDLNEHVPEMSAGDFFRRLLEQFALYIRIVGTSIEFVKKRDMLASVPIDWTSLSEPNYSATRRLRRGFTLQYPDLRSEDKNFLPSTSDYYNTQATEYISGDGFEQYTLPAGIVRSNGTVVALPLSGVLKCPDLNQPGSSDEGGIGDNDYSFRLLFDRGLQPTSNPVFSYPCASHDYTNYAGNPTGALSFDLNDAGGLYHLHHKGILELLADGQPVTLAMRLGIADILTARKWENARRTITLPEGQVTAVIKSIKFKASTQGLGVSLVEFVQEK